MSHSLDHHGQTCMSEDDAKDMIKKYDKNGDLILTKDELTAMILDQASQVQQEAHKDIISKPQKKPAKVQEEKHVASKPKKNPAKVPEEEFKMKLSRSEIRDIFLEHDIDGDGFLTKSEVTKAFASIGSMLPHHKAHYGLALADADGDGLIDEDELEKLIDYAEKVSQRKLGRRC